MEKMGQNFHICLWSLTISQPPRPSADPPPSYGQHDRKVSVFYAFTLTVCGFTMCNHFLYIQDYG